MYDDNNTSVNGFSAEDDDLENVKRDAVNEEETAEAVQVSDEELAAELNGGQADTFTGAGTEVHGSSQGVFSGAGMEAYSDAAAKQDSTHKSAEPWDARKLEPRKKTGWGKRIAVLLLCGILLGGSAAGAYLGITYVGKKYLLAEENNPFEPGNDTKIPEPDINRAEPVNGTADGSDIIYAVSDVAERVMPAMVSIINKYTETYNTWFGQSYSQENASSGSGIIIGQNDSELLIATNYHVVSGSDDIQITFIDGSNATAYIKGTDQQMDLAVVSVALETLSAETKEAIAVASLGSSEDLRLGEPVIAIGNALGYGQSVTTGVVSALDRQIEVEGGGSGSFIQTNAAINPGNSGGALLNIHGEVIGINSNKIGGTTIEGMGYAIPISAAEPIISDLSLQTTKMKVEEEKRGYLGIGAREVTASTSQMYGMPQGVFVSELTKGGAAETAGMRVRDIIVKFDSFKVDSYADLQNAMQYYEIGTTVSVEVMRYNGNEYESVVLELTLGEKPTE